MDKYMAQRIIDGAQDYAFVISRRPDLKAGIDQYLNDKGYKYLIRSSDDLRI